MHRAKAIVVLGLVVGAVAYSVGAYAYSSYAKWGTNSVLFYVNPSNADVTVGAAESALQVGMDAWTNQAASPFQYVYAGRVSDTSTAYDGRNVVIFRNASSGSTIASTYSWWSGGTLVDSDIVFWDGSFRFFTGTSGCGGSNAAYMEDIAAHEFGHALGLNHSSATGATMNPGYSTCSQAFRTLETDDIAGMAYLYPPSTPVATPPVVTIATPTTGTSVASGTSILFSGSAVDTQDGSLTSVMTWRSSLDGALGQGGSLAKVLSAGSHTITATATDSGGLSSSTNVSVTVTSTSTSPPTARLEVRAAKVKGSFISRLSWSGLTTTRIDVYRNGALIFNTANDGKQVDSVGGSAGASYRYKVCGAATTVCSNEATVTF
jgi:hypothetical protein